MSNYNDPAKDFKLDSILPKVLATLTRGDRIVLRVLEEMEVLSTEHLWLRLLAIKCEYKFPENGEVSVTDRELALLGTAGGKKSPRPKAIKSTIKAIKRSRTATIERQNIPGSAIAIALSRAEYSVQGGRPYIYKPHYLNVIGKVIASCPDGTPDWLERQEVRHEVEEFRGVRRVQIMDQSSRTDSSTAAIKRSVTSLHKGIMMEASLYIDTLGLGIETGFNRWMGFVKEKMDETDPEIRGNFLENLHRATESLINYYKKNS